MKASNLFAAFLITASCAWCRAAEDSPRREGDAAFSRLGGVHVASLRGEAAADAPAAVPSPVGDRNRAGRIPELKIELRSQKYAVNEVFRTMAYIADTGPDGSGTEGWVDRTPKYGRTFSARSQTLEVDVDSSDREICSESYYRKLRLPFQSEYKCVKHDAVSSIILTINPTSFTSTESDAVEACMTAEQTSNSLRKILLGPNYNKCFDPKKRGKVTVVDQRSFLDAGSINLHIGPQDLDAVCAAPGRAAPLLWRVGQGGSQASTAVCDPSGKRVSISIALD